mmetsp:Transcript_87154/g.233392  ORF Transcript_87154/g.233392 Transcript_87154/m.233392 type:complete len:232 (-) Transcript_87154:61-756(-)
MSWVAVAVGAATFSAFSSFSPRSEKCVAINPLNSFRKSITSLSSLYLACAARGSRCINSIASWVLGSFSPLSRWGFIAKARVSSGVTQEVSLCNSLVCARMASWTSGSFRASPLLCFGLTSTIWFSAAVGVFGLGFFVGADRKPFLRPPWKPFAALARSLVNCSSFFFLASAAFCSISVTKGLHSTSSSCPSSTIVSRASDVVKLFATQGSSTGWAGLALGATRLRPVAAS